MSTQMKPTMSIVVTFLFIAVATINTSFCDGSSYVACIKSEREALSRFKQDLIDPMNRLASWTSGSGDGDCCTWSGIVCDNLTGHVLELNLRTPPPTEDASLAEFEAASEAYEMSKLSGKINPSLLDLKHLQSLDLSDNNFEGIQIPGFLSSMQNLRYLNLSLNGFQGLIPNQLGNLSNLQYLSIGDEWGSMLYVENLWWLSSLSSLEHLDLRVNLSESSNWLQVINTLPSLVALKLSQCRLSYFPPLPILNFSSLDILDLSYNHFEGPIPDELQNFTSLRHLDLSGNNFNSSIPNWLYRLSHLEELFLSDNSLQGSIDAVGNLTFLKRLGLSYNIVEGGIPESFGRLCNLRSISIAGAKLKQEISQVLDIFTKCASDVLELLDLQNSQVFGLLTNRLRQFKNLRQLLLSENSISGPLPSSLGELSSLETLSLSFNKLNGTLSEIHFVNLTSLKAFKASANSLMMKVSPHWVPPFRLQFLGLSSCHLGPQFPSWLLTQRNLSYLDISNSSILDTIPTHLFKFPLLFLNLSHNQIYGEIPNLTDSTQLDLLDLNSNNLSGPLPLVPFNMYVLDLSNNALSGSLFHFLCHEMNESKNSMQILILNKNFLSEGLPDCWMNWQSLEVLNLDDNRLVGNLPTSIGILRSLQSLKLRNNNFSGTIPVSLKSWTNIVSLDLGENEFIGNIPAWIGESFTRIGILNLRSNKFHGVLPAEVCHLRSLQILDVADNNLFGTIPRCINNFSAMTTVSFNLEMNMGYMSDADFFSSYLEGEVLVNKGQMSEYNTILKFVKVIDLSKNNFSGEIPTEVTNLAGLQSLNLSYNSFTGRIPESIGAMRSLLSIDFSTNQLSGEIPQSISNLTFLGYLNLSNNHLTGKIPSGTQVQSFNASSFTGNELCGPPLPNNCTATISTPNDQYRGEKDGKEAEVDWFYVSMSLGFVVGLWSVIGPLVVNKRWRYMYFHFLNCLQDKLVLAVRKCY